jgi:MFS family permease
MILPVAQAYIGEITPLNREGSMMGLLNISLYAGLSAGPLIGGIVNDLFSIEISFISMGILCLMGFLVSLIFLPPRNTEHIRSPEKKSFPYRTLLKDRNIVGFFTFRLTHALCIGAFWTFTPLIAHTEFNLSGLEIGTVITMSVLVSALLMAPMGILADSLDRRYLIVTGGAAITISMFFISQLQSTWQLYAASLLIGIGGGISMPAILAMSVTMGKNKSAMGFIMAILTMGHSLGMLIGPVISGLLMDLVDFRTAFLGISITMTVVTTSTFFLTAENRH